MTFLELAEAVLQDAKCPLSAEQIWESAKKRGLTKKLASGGKTPWATLGAQLYVAVRDRVGAPFLAVGVRPKRFYLKGQFTPDQADRLAGAEAEVEIERERFPFLEKDLHPLLARYAFFRLKAYTKTINHSKTTKKTFGEWLHPDMVGFKSPLDSWAPEVWDLGSTIDKQAIKLFSFELKRELSFGNLRESFFQAVSNSSWAHEGYLVAASIEEDEEFLTELQRLSSSFGIGIIRLDVEEPDSSDTLFPAQTRQSVDWEGVNKLAINSDFRNFIVRVRNDISSREIRTEQYDKVFEAEELTQRLQKRSA